MRGMRPVLVVMAAMVTLLLSAEPARAHPVLLFTDPAVDSAVAEPPTSVTLVFNEAVTVASDAIEVTDLRGETLPVGRSTTAKNGTVVTTKLDAKLRAGTYRVRWRATGVDGHGVDGEFRFAVGAALAAAATSTGPPGPDWAAAALRWLLLAGFAVSFGGIVAQHFTASARAEDPSLPEVRSWSMGAVALGLAAAAVSAAVLVTDIGATSALWASGPGRAVLTQAAALGLAAALLAVRRPLWALPPLAVVAVAEGAVSHGNVEVPIAGAALTAVHIAAAGLWVGSLLHTAHAVVRWRRSRPAVRWVLLSYARMAAWVFVVVVATGVTTALLLVPLSALTTTPYGQTLLVKLTLVTVAVVLAVLGRRSLRSGRLGRVSRTVPAEATTLVAVLAATAALVSTPTPGSGDGTAAPPPPPGASPFPRAGSRARSASTSWPARARSWCGSPPDRGQRIRPERKTGLPAGRSTRTPRPEIRVRGVPLLRRRMLRRAGHLGQGRERAQPARRGDRLARRPLRRAHPLARPGGRRPGRTHDAGDAGSTRAHGLRSGHE